MSDCAAVTETGWVRSEHYQETMDKIVLPFLKARRKDETVPGFDGKPLSCSVFTADQPRGTAMVLHGFTECAEKFSEIIHAFLRAGYSVVCYDQRGHGHSWRDEGVKDLSLTHVHSFQDYVRDLETVWEKLMKEMPRPHFLLAHSMGGAVAAFFLEQHPEIFAKAVLCSPMIAPDLGGMPPLAVRLLCRAAQAVGQGKKRVFISRPYAGPEDFATSCATGPERFAWFDAIKAATPAYQNNGPTYTWTLQSVGVTRKLLRPGAVEKIACPVRIYAAEEDHSVLSGPQEAFIRRVKRGSRVVIKGSRHEIYRSGDAVVFPWWEDVLKFLSE